MVDSKTVGPQVQKLQLVFHNLIDKDMVLNEVFQVTTMIEKLPNSWNDFENYPKHKNKEMKLEEDIKTTKKKSHNISTIIGVNTIE